MRDIKQIATEVANKSVIDTVKDIIGYSLLLLQILENEVEHD